METETRNCLRVVPTVTTITYALLLYKTSLLPAGGWRQKRNKSKTATSTTVQHNKQRGSPARIRQASMVFVGKTRNGQLSCGTMASVTVSVGTIPKRRQPPLMMQPRDSTGKTRHATSAVLTRQRQQQRQRWRSGSCNTV